MKVGYTKSLITPLLPCHLEGYQDRVATEIHDNLYIHSLLIDNGHPILIHVLDIVIIERELSDYLKDIINKAIDISKDDIFITAIHTHSGPKVSHKLDKNIFPDENYIHLIEKKIISNSQKVLSHKQTAKVYLGETTIEGLYSNRNGLDKPYLKAAKVLKFVNQNDETIVDLVNLACHPTILNAKNLMVSSDFVGTMRATYKILTGCELMFMNAEAGDVSTRLTREGSGFEEVNRVGQRIAESLAGIQSYKEIQMNHLIINKCQIDVNYKPQKDEFIISMIKKLENPDKYFETHDMRYQMASQFKRRLEEKLNYEDISFSPIAYVLEYNDLRIIMLPGEIVYQLAHRIRTVDNKETLLFAYTNDFFGYAVDREQYGQYFETFMSEYPLGEADRFIDNIIGCIKKN